MEGQMSDGMNAMVRFIQNLRYVLGFNKDISGGVHNLTSYDRSEIFYTSAHTGVIYNYETGDQKLLQGHVTFIQCNRISCCSVSSDKRWIATADSGDQSMLVVWDSLTATPYRTIFTPHVSGVSLMDISDDGSYIVTLSDPSIMPQELTVWDWSKDAEETQDLIAVSSELPQSDNDSSQFHKSLRFNQSNAFEIASNNDKIVWFWQWDAEKQVLRYDDTQKDQKNLEANNIKCFTQTVFIPNNSTQAVSGASTGHIVVWDISAINDNDTNQGQRRAIKHVQLFTVGASILQTVNKYLVVGSKDGAVRFYDERFIVEAWFEHIKQGNIMSISFSTLEKRHCGDDLGNYGTNSNFECSDFIVATDKAKIIQLKSTDFELVPPAEDDDSFRQGEVLLHGFQYKVTSIAAHPKRSIIAVAGGDLHSKSKQFGEDRSDTLGYFIYVWDYENKRMIEFPEPDGDDALKKFVSVPLCIEYSPDGLFLVCSFLNGRLLFLDANNIHQERQSEINYTENPKGINKIIFSSDGRAMATMDIKQHVTLFKYDHRRGRPELPLEWQFQGCHKSHYKGINAIAFGESIDEEDRQVLRLFSVSDDRRMIEYDTSSTDLTQLKIFSITKIEQEHHPTSCIWYPVNTGEDLLLTMNTAYKVKLWNVNNKGCRLTCLGPTYGEPVTKLQLLKKYKQQPRTGIDQPDYFLAYATSKQIAGLMKMPADGNPNKIMGLIAHPGPITDITVSGDHNYVFTSGGSDLSVNLWYIDTEAIERQIAIGGQGDEPFENMIEGGKYGQTYKDMKDFFYYSQIRSKKENTTKTRKLEGSVPLDEMANLMRAMGYYPSEQEIENMKNEVKYSQFTETGQAVNRLDMETLLKVYVNHRPIQGVDRSEIKQAFDILSGSQGVISKRDLISLLTTQGEPLTETELYNSFASLLMPGNDEDIDDMISNEITSDDFIEKILGFEDVMDENMERDYEIVEVDNDYDNEFS